MKNRDCLPTYCGKYTKNVEVKEDVGDTVSYLHKVNTRPVGRRYNNDLTYFYCGDCKNFCTDNDDEICNYSHYIFESTEGKIYCGKYEVLNEQ